jgi:HEAT repeat protein
MRVLLVFSLVVLLSGCGPSAPTQAGGKPVRHWVEALQSPDARLRREAAFKLGNVGAADPTALPALVGALKDRDATVRREAVLALLKLGPAAREAVPTLIDLREHDRDLKVRGYAAKALEKLQGAL